MKAYRTFETPRLYLRPTDESDAAFVLELMNSEGWIRYIGDRNVHSITEAEVYIAERMTPQLERLGYGNYTVILKGEGSPIGCCGLYDREGLEGVDIGFALLPQYTGQAYAYEASECIKQAGLNEFGLSQIGAITNPDNLPSQKLLVKLGFSFVKMVQIPPDQKALKYYEFNK